MKKLLKFDKTNLVAVISMILLLNVIAIASTTPASGAAEIETLAYISVDPDPIGVGQTLLVNVWFTPSIPSGPVFEGLTVTFTKPDGTKDIIGPLDGINSNFVKTKQGIYFINYYDEDGKKKYIFQKIIDGEYELLQFGVAPNIGDIVIGYWKLNKYYITITYGLYSSNDELYKVEFEPINNKVEQVEYFPRYFYTNDSIWYQGGRRSYYQL